ncbi:phage tail assembly protein [Parasphingorhabdus sp. JC815]|uniref:phage tail assembly protein n=1 Tax=Parasphingorhabdus sp. JC815 TaxID=3232140 RepID=UPI00345805FD
MTDKKIDAVTLSTPIIVGDKTIEELTLRKPTAGELRGLSLQDIMTSEVNAMLSIIPRICEPVLNTEQVNGLEVDDFGQIAGTIRGFFMTPTERKMIETMMNGQGQSSP